MVVIQYTELQQRWERDCSIHDEAFSLFSSHGCWVWHHDLPRVRGNERIHLLGHSARSSDKNQAVVQKPIEERLGVHHHCRDQRLHSQTLLWERSYDSWGKPTPYVA